MRTVRKSILRWKGTFRGLNPAESLLLYAGSVPQFGTVLWHSHPRNNIPHVHVETLTPSDRYADSDLRDHISPEHHNHIGQDRSDNDLGNDRHHNSHNSGHWHFVIAANHLAFTHKLLVFAVCTIWITIYDQATRIIECHFGFSARAPPRSA